jgi:hypothetical protein
VGNRSRHYRLKNAGDWVYCRVDRLGDLSMHILLGFLAILGGAAFWYWRLKAIKETTDDVTDMALQVPPEG